jgi:spermidine synthase
MKSLKQALLPGAVFITGAGVLVVEIVALRVLAPYFGNTIYSVSSVISVVLAALSAGYWVGGRLADKYPSRKLFFAIIALSGVLTMFIQILQVSILPAVGYTLSLSWGPLIVSIMLFFVPSFVLGLLSPFAVVLQKKQAKDRGVGAASGEIFFFSTLGSIAGSLVAGFVLIPNFGVSAILVGTGAVLFLLGAVPLVVLGLRGKLAAAIVLAGAGVLLLAAMPTSSGRELYLKDGLYERIAIFEGVYRGQPARFLQQDSNSSAAMFLDSDELVYDYTKYWQLWELFAPEVKRALVMGGGAYSIPKAILQDLPQAKVDVSEIEPSLPELAERYFRLPADPNLTHFVEDGRRMLRDTSNRYDLIFSDVYHSLYSVPAHFTTKEFMTLARDRLTEQGVFMANLIGSLEASKESFIWSQIRTMQQIFPQVYVFAVLSPDTDETQNIIVVGSMNPGRVNIDEPKLVNIETVNLRQYPILTDNYAPVDYLTAKALPKR